MSMNIFSRALCRLQPRSLSGLRVNGTLTPSRAITRSLVVLSSNRNERNVPSSTLCSCGCGIHGMHTRGDRELVEFLQEEIVAEKKNQKDNIPSHLDDFSIKVREAEVILTKNFHDEKITVTLNVNHTVDSDETAEVTVDQPDEAVLKSRPSFEVDIQVGPKVMSFTCSYTTPGDVVEGQDHIEDVFGINELTMYEGEWTEDTYCVSGDILDGMMYDLLMNMLEERGITSEFAEKLSNICSDYEHTLYTSLLQQVQDFVKRK
ncbi:complement component 1 Q subcomponent-binding protein, mitochondrial [Panulirus ornatus]|uniref:complement component 1 Q subcomponent-binding protein, mitochondrial n=1 Tax=Panulirus ornatus TaxID=150431 RepID=UPI003A87AA4B